MAATLHASQQSAQQQLQEATAQQEASQAAAAAAAKALLEDVTNKLDALDHQLADVKQEAAQERGANGDATAALDKRLQEAQCACLSASALRPMLQASRAIA